MIFNLNSFLLALSTALDYAEQEIMHITTHHSKRCAYIALRLAQEMGMSDEECFDLCALTLMHDNGITEAFLGQTILKPDSKKVLPVLENLKEHCNIGEANIKNFPLFGARDNVILYHHEYLDGSGLYGKTGSEIPLMSQIICFVDDLDMHFDLLNVTLDTVDQLNNFAMKHSEKRFDVTITMAFLELSKRISFWRDLRDEHIISALENYLPLCTVNVNPTELLAISSVFSKIIDAKSTFTAKHSLDLMHKATKVTEHFKWDRDKSIKFQIAANLHDIGKLAMPTAILEKDGPLSHQEFQTIKEHARITHTILGSINGFNEIHAWASTHHERLDGSGYPFGLSADALSFESKLLATLDMYQALTEDRPYREAMSHHEAIGIMMPYAHNGELDIEIVETLNKIFHPDDAQSA